MENQRILFLLTSEYPFGKSDVFVDTELEAIRNHFDEVHILPVDYDPKTGGKPYFSPVNTFVHVMKTGKPRLRFLSAFHPRFLFMMYGEFAAIRKYFPSGLNIRKFKIMLGSYIKMRGIFKEMKRVLSNTGNAELFLYSFWINESVVASLIYRMKNNEKKIKVFCRGCGWDIYFERHPDNYLPWRKFIFEKTDAVYCVGESAVTYLKEKFKGIDTSRVSYSYMGVDSPARQYQKRSFSGTTLGILSCSTIVPVKRIDFLIRALADLDGIQIRWVHIGGGDLLREFRKLAEELFRDKKNISFEMPGYVPLEKRDEYLCDREFHLFVNSSSTEGLPVSVMEAMSCSFPLLAFDVGGLSEMIEDGQNGFLLKNDSGINSITDAIRRFAELPVEAKEKMGQASFLQWQKKFNAANNYRDFLKRISELHPIN